MFELYTRVRVRRLLRPPDAYDSFGLNQRPPQIGEVGTYIDLLQAPGLPDHYVVESCGPLGVPIWLAEFVAQELEPFEERIA